MSGATGRLASLGGADGTVLEDTIIQVPVTMAGQVLDDPSAVPVLHHRHRHERRL